jgi:hypothetical protein
MVLEATFTGQLISLGYKPGHIYTLILADTAGVTVKQPNGTGIVAYASLSAFFKNWNHIKVLNIKRFCDLEEGEHFRFPYDNADVIRTVCQKGNTEIYCPSQFSVPNDEGEVYLKSGREVYVL